MDIGREYVRLALRLNRLAPGTVTGYHGDPARFADIAAEPPAEPRALAAAARSARAASTDIPEDRGPMLDAGLTAFEHTAAVLGGRRTDHRTDTLARFQLTPGYGEQDDYRAAHRELAALLPGTDPLPDRIAAHARIPPQALQRCVAALSEALAERTRTLIGLPDEQRVRYRFGPLPVAGRQRYLGGHVSEVHIDTSRPLNAAALANLVAHEAYPGHHTEHCRAGEHPERTVDCPNTPRAAITEGAAELGLDVLLHRNWGAWLTDVLAEAGVRVDGELAEAVHRARDRLRPVRQDAALLLHERHRAPDEVADYVRRWALASENAAHATVEFLREPANRCRATAYVGGRALLDRWLAGQPNPLAAFRRLLDEPLVPATLPKAPVNLSETDESCARFG